jgi:hypothetical protein
MIMGCRIELQLHRQGTADYNSRIRGNWWNWSWYYEHHRRLASHLFLCLYAVTVSLQRISELCGTSISCCYISTYPSIHPCIHASIYPSIYLSSLSIYPSIYLVYPPSICKYLHDVYIYTSIYIYIVSS